MEPTKALTVVGTAVSISVSSEAYKARDTLLAEARKGTIVTTPEGAVRCADIMKRCREFAGTIEDLRVEATAPLLEAQRDIMAKAKELSTDVKAEADRLGRLLGNYDIEQKRLAEEARQKAWAEEQRVRAEAIQREQAEIQRVRDEQAKRDAEARAIAEQARLKAEAEARAILEKNERAQAEAQAKANRARSEEGRARAMAEAEAARIKAEHEAFLAAQRAEEAAAAAQAKAAEDNRLALAKAEADAAAAVAATAQQLEVIHADANAKNVTKIKGVRTGMKLEFNVTNVVALYESMPILVKLEPKMGMIASALKDLNDGESLPGVQHWYIAKSS